MENNIVELKVTGMNCNNCANGLSKYLQKQGLEDVYVNFQTEEVRFQKNNTVSIDTVKEGIHKMGYRVVNDNQPETIWWTLERKLWISTLFTLPLFLYHFIMMAGVHIAFLENPWVQLALCLPVFAIGVEHFGRSAFSSLRTGIPNMDVLIFVGSTAAFAYSIIGLVLQEPNYIFFETAATIITLVLLGNYIEKRAVDQTTSAIAELSELQPEQAKRIMPSGTIISVPLNEVQVGDILQVNEGDKVPTDGVILEGFASVDESMLTGESEAVEKQKDSRVVGASVVQSGNFRMQVRAMGKNTVLHQMIELVKRAQEEKPDIQRLADQISAIFVPVVLGISALTFTLAYLVFDIGFQQALMNAIAVLVISCPCAMGLATPTAVMVGVGRLARNGILVKGGQTLEVFAKIKNFIFDKTGTLTDGQFEIKQIDYHTDDQARANAIIYRMEQFSSHPIAKSLVKEMESRLNGVRVLDLSVEEEKGRGLVAMDDHGQVYRLGSKRILKDTNAQQSAGAIYLTENDKLLATVQISDRIKEDAKPMIDYLKSQSLRPIILSGDVTSKTQAVAQQLGIEEVYAEQLPEQKLEVVDRLAKAAPTAMVGDGINDAPALAKADIGVSLSNASQVAIQSAQVVLLNGQLGHLEKALKISRHTVLTIKQNLFWAFAYNIVAIPIAALGFLNPMWGALFMAFSDVVVIGNSIRLKHKRIR
ncbi:MAG: cadmium-translocating P-type ATPase [Saprospiraceae bacterium]|nr:cadmium-translocating P-type ATPase [Saprospiraceae bacterium]